MNLRTQSGWSLIETLVGMAVGLMVCSGAATLMMQQARTLGQLAQSMRVEQDLQEALDVIRRELRRAGYRQAAPSGDSHDRLQIQGSDADLRIDWLSSDLSGSGAAEQRSLRLSSGVLQLRSSTQAGFQSFTDPGAIEIRSFRLSPMQLGLCTTAYRIELQAVARLGLRQSGVPRDVQAWVFTRNQGATECRA